MSGNAEIQRDSLVFRNARTLTTSVGMDLVMMDVEKDYYYGLDEIGSRIWEALAEPVRVDALCDALAAQYGVEVDVCVRDVLPFLEQLRKQGLLVVQQTDS